MKETLYRRAAQKRYNFAPGGANHTSFWLTLYIIQNYTFSANQTETDLEKLNPKQKQEMKFKILRI